MKKNYPFGLENPISLPKITLGLRQAISPYIQVSINPFISCFLVIGMLFGTAFIGYGQKKGKNKDDEGHNGNKNDVILFTCIRKLDNGMYEAYFGYTNPTNQTITVDQKDSFVYLKDALDTDESDDDAEDIREPRENHHHGVEKLPGIKSFKPGTVAKAFSVVFNGRGHAKWTVVFPGQKRNEQSHKTKVWATSRSSVCSSDNVIFPVFGGAGKSYTLIGAELTALATNNAGEQPSGFIYQIKEGKVLLEIVPKEGQMQNALALLTTTGGFNVPMADFTVAPAVVIAKNYATIDVFFPINRLLELNDYPTTFNFIRPMYLPFPKVGIAETQGDGAMLTNIARESFGTRDSEGNFKPLDGTGVLAAVISDSFDTQPASAGQPSKATVDAQQGDLPGAGNPQYPTPVQVLKEYPNGVGSDEGRAMLQILHDVAPGATLGFRTGVLSPRDLSLGIDNLADAGYSIIVDDITYPLEPFFQDGQIAESIKRFTAISGNFYFTSAGNFKNIGYQSVFVNSTAAPVTDFLTGGSPARAHVFGANQDVKQKIQVAPGTYMIVLQWNEDLASQNNQVGAATDLDIYLVDDAGNRIVDTNRVNLFGDSVEAMLFEASASAPANIMIVSANGPAPANLAFRYIVFRSDGLQIMEYNSGAPTVSGHAMTAEAITVGAVDYRVAQNPSAEAFSSYAGILSNNRLLQVDISAPDGGNTNVGSIGQDISADPRSFTQLFWNLSCRPPCCRGLRTHEIGLILLVSRWITHRSARIDKLASRSSSAIIQK